MLPCATCGAHARPGDPCPACGAAPTSSSARLVGMAVILLGLGPCPDEGSKTTGSVSMDYGGATMTESDSDVDADSDTDAATGDTGS